MGGHQDDRNPDICDFHFVIVSQRRSPQIDARFVELVDVRLPGSEFVKTVINYYMLFWHSLCFETFGQY